MTIEGETMKPYDVYVFVLCMIVFVMFVGVFSYLLYKLLSMNSKLIENGIEDENIKAEYEKTKRKRLVSVILDRVISALICIVMCSAAVFSVYMNMTEGKRPNGIPSLKVVKSASMSYKHAANEYLIQNDLDDQIQTFDVIVTRHLPPEENLKLFDIVMYEVDNTYLVHRIVGIEEPNENHPDHRHFLLQGDAVSAPDIFPVLYSQMHGIYYGERIPFVGSFIMFMQSPAGWFCLVLVLVALIGTPILEKNIYKKKMERLRTIGYIEK